MSLDSTSDAQPARPVSVAPPIDRRSTANITTRRLAPSDSLLELTRLLHRAYAKQVSLGLQPLAGRQTPDITEKRVFSGECYVAVDHAAPVRSHTGQKLVGTILFHEVEESKGPPWFEKPEVASFSQLAVDPDYQGCGIGRLLMEVVETRARTSGAKELGLSMAEPDRELYDFYLRRGYRFIEHWKWPYTNYRSAILSKTIA